MEDFYRILNVSRASTQAQLKKSIVAKRLAHGSAGPAEDAIARALLTEAERILLQPELRAAYDLQLRQEPPGPPSLPPEPIPGGAERNCRHCRQPVLPDAIFCIGCGSTLNGPGPPTPEPRDPRPTVEPQPASPLARRGRWFIQRIQGTVTAVESHEVRHRRFVSWLVLVLFMVAGVAAAVYVILPIVAMIAVIVILLAVLTRSFGSIFQLLFLPFTLLRGAHLPKVGEKSVRIIDCRVRQEDGSEIGVRIEGELAVGSISPGDEVEIVGRFRRGTFIFLKGQNRRTGSELRKEFGL